MKKVLTMLVLMVSTVVMADEPIKVATNEVATSSESTEVVSPKKATEKTTEKKVAVSSKSGDLAFTKGSKAIGLGLYIPHGRFYEGLGIGFEVAGDFGIINDMISLGGEFGIAVDHYNVSSFWGFAGYDIKSTHITPLVRVGFHPFGLPPLAGKVKIASKLDPFVIATGGFDVMTTSYDFKTDFTDAEKDMLGLADYTETVAVFEVGIGARYNFTDLFAGWLEFTSHKYLLGVALTF